VGGTILEEQEAPGLGVGYLLLRFSLNISTTNVAKATANISAWYVLHLYPMTNFSFSTSGISAGAKSYKSNSL